MKFLNVIIPIILGSSILLANDLTMSQKNAIKSAQIYIKTMPFSKKGLIEQLSSDYGEGYSIKESIIAVNSLKVDWNEQALKSAKVYLNIMPYSCKNLIKQLSSNAGSKFTLKQAKYAAKAVGLCK